MPVFGGGPAAHATTHAPGGADPLDWSIGSSNVATPFDILAAANANTFTQFQVRASRVTIRKTGTLVDLAVLVTTFSGSLLGAVFDTGQLGVAGDHTVRTRLDALTSVTPAGNGWFSLGNPNLAVVAGQELDFAVCADNVTIQLQRLNTSAAQTALPSGYRPPHGAGTVTTKLAWAQTQGSLSIPATITDTNAASNASTTLIIGRIS